MTLLSSFCILYHIFPTPAGIKDAKTSFPTCSNITNIADLKKSAAHPIMAVELKQK